MIQIQLYKPRQYDITLNFPSTWEELSFAQLKYIAKCFFSRPLPATSLFLSMLHLQLLQNHYKDADNIIKLLNPEDVALHYTGLTQFISQRISLTKNPFSIPGVTGPKDSFEDITVGEFEECDIALREFNQGKKESLRELFTIYFRTNISLPFDDMLVAALLFVGCKNQLPSMFPLVFPEAEETTENNSPTDPLALTRIIHMMAGTKNGTRDHIRKTPLLEFLYECQLEAETKSKQ